MRIARGAVGSGAVSPRERRRGDGRDREAVVGALVLAGAWDVVGRLGRDDVRDAAARDRALRVAEDDAGLGVDAVAVDRDAGDVDRQQARLERSGCARRRDLIRMAQRRVLRVGAVDHHDRADGVADARVASPRRSARRWRARACGLIVTRSAPAPLIVTSRMMIRPFEPDPAAALDIRRPGRSRSCRPAGAAKIAFWIVVNVAAGTVLPVVVHRQCRRDRLSALRRRDPSAANTAARTYASIHVATNSLRPS